MSYKFLPLLFLGFLAFKPAVKAVKTTNNVNDSVKIIENNRLLAENKEINFEVLSKNVFNSINKGAYSLPSLESFTKAFEGYEQLKKLGKVKNEVLTIIDFSLSSTKERMWVIDMTTQRVILQSLVSHGMNSGTEYAKSFSNENNSHKSSLGFYLTGETYNGKHGLSMKLDGQEYGVNHNARERAVVVHGAEYVNKNLIKTQGYIGRSQGCPAVPTHLTKKLIDITKNKSVLYIHHPSRIYMNKSSLTS